MLLTPTRRGRTPDKEALYEHFTMVPPCPPGGWTTRVTPIQRTRSFRERIPLDDNRTPDAEVIQGFERIIIGYALEPGNAGHAAEELADIDPRWFSLPAHEVVFDAAKRFAGTPDARMRVIESLIGPNAPRALNALDTDLTGFVSACVREAECLGEKELRYYARRLRETHKRRVGETMLAQLGEAFQSGDTDRIWQAWAAFAEAMDGAKAPTEEALAPSYGDVAALVANTLPDPPRPEVLHRDDRVALFYRGKVNVLFGDSESGKTWIALAALVEVLASGGRAACLDLDHNGMNESVGRMLALGAKPADLGDTDRFRYCEPEDATDLDWFVRDLAAWRPDAVVADSVGEILPMLDLSSNSPDDYTKGNRRVLTPLANADAAVIAIDHLPKDDAAREKGQTGTLAKKRTVNGVTLRVSVKDQFAPGRGGSANLTVNKDRPGGLRGHCPAGKNAPAGRFVMTDRGNGVLSWRVTKPAADGGRKAGTATDSDIAELDALNPPPSSQRDVQERLKWGSHRAMNALRMWRELREVDVRLDGP